ncbi:potassium transporter Kup [Tanticharoenia sakaeratensis]|uniref:Probable potassium transport system protein Kup n=1 Tax=Tanticharoenia sakaeratensis NBRC 103193 TaxID=1231623 RepID=A0A0D6MJS4_9PROT|nr:KUP/HAK/KT family potassium transporter [Tanticharoenia sakaeratensis]GAN53528.1 potassium uptake protein Kup [Tanticharoenia sakaeratensis NBRC 103193]GBQ17645.1 K+ transporter [Tanticharoenia sakaeratensis NBRC 103193]
MSSAEHEEGRRLVPGALAALGIVFGDIGTSPLYTFQTVMNDTGGATDPETLLGGFSLLVWTMVIVVALKYAVLVMRADNRGEGGILALLSLVGPRFGASWHSRATLLAAAGLFGAALLYGDGAITPAISVLSAIEGIGVVAPHVHAYVLPAAVVVLFGIFMIQPLGTAHISKVFGPVMALWFALIGILGIHEALSMPRVFVGLDPIHGLRFLLVHYQRSLVILGAVFLSVTGAEALYADMSHVGRPSVRLALGVVVLPMLILSYAGQTAYLLAHPSNTANPFFAMLPHPMILPVVVLATLATIIASQAIITGAYTLTRQAMQLGWFPGLNIRQTSDTEYGQIYVPVVNWILMMVTLAVALFFRSSDNLSGAYGTAVSTTMLMTTILMFDVMRKKWNWPFVVAGGIALFFGAIDMVFFVANLMKIARGGYVPLAIGLAIFIIMTTWRRGVDLMREGFAPLGERASDVLAQLDNGTLMRTPGSFVFLSRYDSAVPPLVARHVADFQSLPEVTVALNVSFESVPRILEQDRMQVRRTAEKMWQIGVKFGFVEIPNLFAVLREAKELGCQVDLSEVLFIVGDDDIVASDQKTRMNMFRRLLFGFLYRNAVRAPDRFTLPRERLIEIGHQVGI